MAVILTMSAALLLLPAASQAAQIFGSRLKGAPDEGVPNASCANTLGVPCTIASFIEPSEPKGDPDSSGAPSDGVITKFRIRAAAETPNEQVTFRLANVTPDAEGKTALATAAGTGPTVTLQQTPPEEAPIQEFAGRLPVKKGQHLAVDATDAKVVDNLSGGHKFSYLFAPPLVEGAGARGSNEFTGELLVQATLEPDADGDGFGDETQDRCPTQKTTQGPCDLTPPAVSGFKVSAGKIAYGLSEPATVSFLLARKMAGHKVTGKCVVQTAKNRSKPHCPFFRAIGAAFAGPGDTGANQLALPGARKLKPGTYRLTMTATDLIGNTTTQTTNFTVKKKKKKK